MQDIEVQLIDLQTRVAYQEDTLNQLNDVITNQDHEIRWLKQQLVELAERLKDALFHQAQGATTIHDERPPHY